MTTKIVDPITIGFILVALIATIGSVQDSQAGEIAPFTIDAIEADIVYTSAGPNEVAATTRAFAVPKGYRMIEVTHPPKLVCSSYPTPSTWELERIYTAPAKPKGLSEAGALILKQLEDTQ